MNTREWFILITTLLGGLALFVFGIQVMTEGMRRAFGGGLQRLLAGATRTSGGGFVLGGALGAAVHSSAGTVMLVGFVNAGLLTLGQSIAPMLGANVGTTLSMQVISLRLGDYAFLVIALGLLGAMAMPTDRGRQLGRSLLGFGLLFLGMQTMSGAVSPHREALAVYLQSADGATLGGMLVGVLVAGALTAIWQSSGATIGIVFALVAAGVFTRFSQVFPIVLGAHLGTCATALLGSLGTGIEARRCALAHLGFNVFNVLLAIALRPLFFWLIPLASADLTRQTANLHTAVMLLAALLVLPWSRGFARLIRRMTPSRQPVPQASLLDYDLLQYPERAIVAAVAELQRTVRIAAHSMALAGRVMLEQQDKRTIATIRKNEEAINRLKTTIGEYLMRVAENHLSRRQTIVFHYLNRCLADIERIGDHVEQLCDHARQRSVASLDSECMDSLFALYLQLQKMLTLLVASLEPGQKSFQFRAGKIMRAHETYSQRSQTAQSKFLSKAARHELDPAAALFFREYIAIMDRMSRHIKSIAMAESDKDFRVRETKLDRRVERAGRTFHSIQLESYLKVLREKGGHTD